MPVEACIAVQLSRGSGTPQLGCFRTYHVFLLIPLDMLSNFPSRLEL